MVKRANGEGSIFQRKDGRWVAEVSYISDSGKRKRKTMYGKSQQEAVQKMKKFTADIERGELVEPQKTTTGQWLSDWLEIYKKPNLRPKTYEQYEMLIRVHIKPHIGNIRLQQLQPRRIQTFYNDLRKNGRKDGRGKELSPRTVRLVHVVAPYGSRTSRKRATHQRKPRRIGYATEGAEKRSSGDVR